MKVLKFYAEWCGPCKALSQVIKNAGDKITVTIEDVDIDNNIMMAQQFQIRGVPAMVMVDDQENEIKRKVGMINEAQLSEFLKG